MYPTTPVLVSMTGEGWKGGGEGSKSGALAYHAGIVRHQGAAEGESCVPFFLAHVKYEGDALIFWVGSGDRWSVRMSV